MTTTKERRMNEDDNEEVEAMARKESRENEDDEC
jgi:hypothetical protein